MRTRMIKALLIVCIVLVNIGCDQATKQIARKHLADKGTVFLVDRVLVLRYVENEGGFLSLGAGLPKPVRSVVFIAFPLIVLGCMLAYFVRARHIEWRVLAGFAFLLGGGMGNLIDRLLRDGRVSDFINVGIGRLRTGIFNFADLSVMLGCLLLVASSWTGRPSHAAPPPGSALRDKPPIPARGADNLLHLEQLQVLPVAFLLQIRRGNKSHRRRVHAVAQPRGRGPVVEEMPQVRISVPASHLGADHSH